MVELELSVSVFDDPLLISTAVPADCYGREKETHGYSTQFSQEGQVRCFGLSCWATQNEVYTVVSVRWEMRREFEVGQRSFEVSYMYPRSTQRGLKFRSSCCGGRAAQRQSSSRSNSTRLFQTAPAPPRRSRGQVATAR